MVFEFNGIYFEVYPYIPQVYSLRHMVYISIQQVYTLIAATQLFYTWYTNFISTVYITSTGITSAGWLYALSLQVYIRDKRKTFEFNCSRS